MTKRIKLTSISVATVFLLSLAFLYFNNYTTQKYASASVKFTKLEGSTIVAFGDSITEGIHISEEKKWTLLLGNMLNAKVINSGIAGNTTKDGLKRIDEDVLKYNADYVLLNFGMNDHYLIEENEPMISLKRYEKNLIKMISLIKKDGAVPIIVLPHMVIEGEKGDGNMGNGASYYYHRHPSKLYKDGANRQLKLYNDKANEIATKYSVPVIDMYNGSSKVNLYKILRTEKSTGQDDGVHLSEEGMVFYADTISKALKGIVK